MVFEPYRAAPSAAKLTVLLTSVASDAHTWNLVYLHLLLEELGHRVTNLGACVPDDLLVEQCRTLRPDLVVVSTVNGHGVHDGRRVVRRLRSHAELRDTPMVIGGKLGIAGADDRRHAAGLLEDGFDAVFEDSTGATAFREYIRALPAGVAA